MRLTQTSARYLRDQTGATLVYVLLVVPVMIGVLGLSLDLQRAFTLNTELQDLADAAAIAGARELDGLDGARARAREAAVGVVDNAPLSGTAYAGVHIDSTKIKFLKIDEFGNCTAIEAEGDGDASCIWVPSEPRFAPAIFIDALQQFADVKTAASATARNLIVACQVTPMMMCTPTAEIEERFDEPGALFALKDRSPGSSLGPGVFALLDPPSTSNANTGAAQTSILLASPEPGFCFFNNVSVATGGRTVPVADGINARFDIFGNSPNDPLKAFPPAPNVTKGLFANNVNNACNSSQLKEATSADTNELLPFPLDSCFYAGTCDLSGENRVGEGDWDRAAYFTRNHAGKTLPTGYTSWTRYQTYMWELGYDSIDDETPGSTRLPATAGNLNKEKPIPQCKPAATPVGNPSRRIIYIAVADCKPIQGNATPDLRSARYGKFFLIRPSFDYGPASARHTTKGEILAEFIGWEEAANGSDVLKQIVELVDYPAVDGVASAQ